MAFGIGEKKTTSNTTNQTTNQYSDSSANAGGDGSIAVGEGGSVVIENLSEGVALGAINAGVKQTEFVVNTLRGVTETAAKETEETRNAADRAIKANSGLLSQLQQTSAAAIERSQAPEASSLTKILTPLLIAAVVIAGLFFFRRK